MTTWLDVFQLAAQVCPRLDADLVDIARLIRHLLHGSLPPYDASATPELFHTEPEHSPFVCYLELRAIRELDRLMHTEARTQWSLDQLNAARALFSMGWNYGLHHPMHTQHSIRALEQQFAANQSRELTPARPPGEGCVRCGSNHTFVYKDTSSFGGVYTASCEACLYTWDA